MSQFAKLSIKDLKEEDYAGKRVICRVDFNVPMEDGKITDDIRIKATLPTINHILSQKIKCLTIVSHLGRPKGKKNPTFSLKMVSEYLGKLLAREIVFVPTLEELPEKTKNAKEGTVFFLENIRFYPEEESKETNSEEVKKFRATFTDCADIYVCDAFACCHRGHSSIVGFSGDVRVAGFLLLKEIEYFGKALTAPPKPFLAILGGKKVDTKIGVIDCLIEKVDEMIICGGMAYTFKKVCENMEIGQSIFDKAGAKVVKEYMKKADEKGVKIHLPVDFVCTDDFCNPKNLMIREDSEGIPETHEGVDIGPKSRELFSKVIQGSKLCLWNGPPGVFEREKYAEGTKALCKVVSESKDLVSVIGGGDTAFAVKKFGAKVSHISTGGGASLELCEGKQLPGIVALSDKK